MTFLLLGTAPLFGNATPHVLSGGNFSQDWTNTGLITTNDVWTGVPSVDGFRGDGLTGATAVDPQTVLASDTPGVIDVNANRNDPNVFATGGVTEFDGIANPVVALTGSGTARAPYLKIYLDTTGQTNINVAYNLRDIDGSGDNSIQRVALQFRVGNSGSFTNVPAGFVADASSGPSLATLVTPVSALLPASANNQALVEVRIMTTDAVGSDEWIGIDDIVITSAVVVADVAPSVLTTAPPNGASGVGLAANIDVTFSEPVNVSPGWFTINCTVSGLHAASESGGPTTFTLDPTVDFVANEICTVTIDDAFVSDQDADDPPDNMAADFVWSFDTNPPPPLVVNEIDYDQSGTDAAEFIEIRNNGGAPVNLDPVVIELVNGNLGGAAVYQTIDLPNVNLAPGAYFVICANNTTTPNCNLDVTPNTNLIQNGPPDAVALRWNGVLVDTVSYEGDTGAPYTETSGSGLEDDGTDDFAGISRFPDGGDTGVNNADLSERCITPGAANAASTAPCAPPAILGLSIDDVVLAEGQAGTRTFTFTVSLSQPAPPGGVTFDIATADGTAEDDNPASEDNDYVPQTLTGQTIPMAATQYTFDVTVNSDVTIEPDETFFVNVTNVTGTSVGDPQGVGTIQNDDFASITLIHDIQGPGASSPEDGNIHTVHGVVTGVKSNGFFVQEEEVDYDADPATSEGIFVFTSSAPPAAAQMGNLVYVTGTVAEFAPSSDPQQPPVTELTSPSTVLDVTGVPLPAPIPLTPTFPDPAGPFDQLERVEGMRVSAASITVTGPSDGSFNESAATGTSNGRFHGVITGVARPFREAGIQAPDAPPTGSIPPIPRWDFNPERLRIESATINAQPVLTVKSSDIVAPVQGPLDYGFRGYAIYPDGTLGTPVITPGTLPAVVTAPAGNDVTISSFNLQRFFDNVNDPVVGDPVLTLTAYNNRLAKASIAIRNHLLNPDIIGVQEAEKLLVLQDLAAKILADGGPDYDAFLTEGNDVGGIDVGFLVKTDLVTGGVPRVTVNSVTQVGAATNWISPDDGNPALLNDRPPLVLDAVVNRSSTLGYPVIVIVNHLRSLIGIDSNAPDGLTTEGDRVRRKRQTQADFLAQYVQTRQTATPGEHIVLVGDFNAFEVNDGYADLMNTIAGMPPPDNETVVCATCPSLPDTNDGVDQVNPDLTNLVNTPAPPERYSYVHEGNAQNIDHALVSAGVVSSTTARRIEHPRIDADYPETERNNNATAFRISDHDPVVVYLTTNALATADLEVTKTDSPDPVNAGANLTYTITVTNNGPDPADTASWSDALPAGTTFVSLPAVAGWSCSTPAVGANGTVSCSNPSFAVGSSVFTLTVNVDPSVAAGTVLSNTATASAPADTNTANDSDTETTTVATSADLLLSKTDSPDPVFAGTNLSYQITITNNGPSNAASASFTDTLPPGTTFVSLSTTGPWSCTTPAVGANGTVSCTNTSFLVTVDFFTLVVNVDPSVADGTVLSNTASMASATSDPNLSDNSDTAATTVTASADLSVTKTDSPDPVTAGTNLTYTITVTNNGPSNAAGATLADTVPANTTFVSLSLPGGWSCTTPAVGGTGAINCSNGSLGVGSAVFTLTVNVNASAPDGTIITNTATASSTTSDPDGSNNSDTATTTVGTGSADLAVTKTDTPDPVDAGTNLTYTITVTNTGPTNATSASVSDTLPAGTTFVSLTSPGGWSCITPAVGANGPVSCSNPSLGVTSAVFTLVVQVNPATAAGTVITNTATTSSATTDPDNTSNSSTSTTTVSQSADLSIIKTDSPDPVQAGTNLTYSINVTNNGPSFATAATMSDTLPAETTFVSVSAPAGWSCTTPAVGATGTVSCGRASMPLGTESITLTVMVGALTPNATVISNTATVSATSTDPNNTNDSSTTTTTVTGAGAYSATKTVSGTFVTGGTVTYTVVLTNNVGFAMPNNPTDEFTDVLPSGLALVSATATSGTAVANIGTNTVTWNGSLANSASVTITITATITATSGTISNQGFAHVDLDNNASNETDIPTDDDSGAPGFQSTQFGVVSPGDVTATKSVVTTTVPGSSVTYTIVITNNMPHTQGDNPGDEFVDVLPAQLVLVSATATSGAAFATVGTNTVTWNGSIGSGASVTITINATISLSATGSVSNQGSVNVDLENDGTNNTPIVTDDPATGTPDDPTVFVIGAATTGIPTLSEWMLLALAMMLAGLAAMKLRM